MHTITVKGKEYEVSIFRGKVIDNQNWQTSETIISGGGGHGIIYNGTGYSKTNPVESHTQTTSHGQLYVQCPSGKQSRFNTGGFHFSALPGHEVAVIGLWKPNTEEGEIVLLLNLTLNESKWNNSRLEKVTGIEEWWGGVLLITFPWLPSILSIVIAWLMWSFSPFLWVFGLWIVGMFITPFIVMHLNSKTNAETKQQLYDLLKNTY